LARVDLQALDAVRTVARLVPDRHFRLALALGIERAAARTICGTSLNIALGRIRVTGSSGA
jgi:hypothetical protein